jgi:hypothetical protein
MPGLAPLRNRRCAGVFCLTATGDNFGGDFNERFFRALRFNHEQLSEGGIDHELVFVEWNPVPGKPYLAELLAEEFPDWYGSGLVSYVADERYHRAFSLNRKMKFLEFIAKNVGIRRASGNFVLSSNTDIYYGRGLVEAISRRDLQKGILYRTTRTDLKLGTDVTHIDWALLEDHRNHVIVNRLVPPLYTEASGDFLLLDRASYDRLKGFNEVYRVAKIHIDANFCMKAYANGYRLVDLGQPIYHLNHLGSYHITRSSYQDRPAEAPWGDDRWNWWVIYDNPDDWGLGNAPERKMAEGLYHLDFVLESVPPLLNLRRVLLPASRTGVPAWR